MNLHFSYAFRYMTLIYNRKCKLYKKVHVLIGMQIPEKYKENVNVSSEGASTLRRELSSQRNLVWPSQRSAFARNDVVLLVFFR